MGHLILAGITGAVVLLLFLTTLYYSFQVKGAEAERDEAIKMSAQALDAKEAAEDGFQKMKTVFDEKMKMPVAAVITQEQLDYICRYLAERLMIATARDVPSIKQ